MLAIIAAVCSALVFFLIVLPSSIKGFIKLKEDAKAFISMLRLIKSLQETK